MIVASSTNTGTPYDVKLPGFRYGDRYVQRSAIERVQAYLDKLPEGVHAYPDARVKFSIVRTWLEGHDPTELAGVVPESVHPLLESGVPITRWVPEVHATCIYLALRELYFRSDDAFVEDALERNLRLLQNPMYRILMRVISRDRAAKSTALAFSQMHRGTDIDVERDADAWLVTLRHPPHMIPELLGRCYATATRATLEVKGFTNVRAEPERLEPAVTTLRVRFDGR